MNNPLVSVIMAIYNEPIPWMKEAVDSILNQTLSDFEFLIIDDNPTRAENQQLMTQYQKTDDRIRYIRNEENVGLTKSLNKGLELAQGKYVARMDADDISLPERFAVQLDFLRENPEYVLCGIWVEYFGVKNRIRKYKVTHEEIMIDMLYDSPVPHPGFFVNGEILRRNKIRYDETFRTSQDYAMCFELSKAGKLHNIPQVLLRYRMSPNRVTITKRKEQLGNASRIRRNILNHHLSELSIDFDPKIDELQNGRSLKEFRKIKGKIPSRAGWPSWYLNSLKATITALLYSSVTKNRLENALSLLLKDTGTLLYEPKKYVKAFLYLLKVRPAKETLCPQ